jgi:acetylornithine deacetylase
MKSPPWPAPRRWWKPGDPRGRFAVIGEPTSLKPIRLHKGVMMERVRITGRSGHSSDPSLGHNALDAMTVVMQRLMAFRAELAQQYRNPAFSIPSPTLNLGCIHGGDNPNRICGQCEMQFDLRPLPGMDTDVLRQRIRDRIRDIPDLFGVTVLYEPIFEGTPAAETPADSPLVQMVEKLTHSDRRLGRVWHRGPVFPAIGHGHGDSGRGQHRNRAPARRIPGHQKHLPALVVAQAIDTSLLCTGPCGPLIQEIPA